jgi:hypothetical protein
MLQHDVGSYDYNGTFSYAVDVVVLLVALYTKGRRSENYFSQPEL